MKVHINYCITTHFIHRVKGNNLKKIIFACFFVYTCTGKKTESKHTVFKWIPLLDIRLLNILVGPDLCITIMKNNPLFK